MLRKECPDIRDINPHVRIILEGVEVGADTGKISISVNDARPAIAHVDRAIHFQDFALCWRPGKLNVAS